MQRSRRASARTNRPKAGRSQGIRVGRWVYTRFLKSLTDDEFDFIRTLDSFEDLGLAAEDDGQDDDDAE